MTLVNLVYMATPNTGGWVSFTAHLAHGFNDAGHLPFLIKAGKRTERIMRPFGMGFQYANHSAPMLEYLASRQPMIVTACEPKRGHELAPLLQAGAGVVVHDPTELKGSLADALGEAWPGRVFVVRRSMLKHVPQATYVPHPYKRVPSATGPRSCHAVAFSRLDWDKHTHMIAQANQLLPAGKRVAIYGSENRLYTHHKLSAEVPTWRDQYHGPMTRDDLWAGARLAGTARYSVDLSAIKGDGGGTQYTFLEALDGASRLVINSRWLTGQSDLDEMTPYAYRVSTGDELAELLARPKYPEVCGTGDLFATHSAAHVARQVLEPWS